MEDNLVRGKGTIYIIHYYTYMTTILYFMRTTEHNLREAGDYSVGLLHFYKQLTEISVLI